MESRIGKVGASSEVPDSQRGFFLNATSQTGVPTNMLAAVAKAESSFNQSAGSGAGAVGIMQLMPDTAKGLGVNPFSAQENILGGARYLRSMLNQFGDPKLAFAAYNAGPGAVQKAMDKAGSTKWDDVKQYLPQETQNYVPKVLSYMGG